MMDWQQKLEACQAMGDISLKMRKPGDWYVNHSGVERREGSCLSSGCVTGAKTPEDAVNQHWLWLTCPGYYLVQNAFSNRRAFRWNGFMWKEIEEKKH